VATAEITSHTVSYFERAALVIEEAKRLVHFSPFGQQERWGIICIF
jgi:hypothetical protein